MANATLHTEALNYPTIQAQNNRPLEVTLKESLIVEMPVRRVGLRAVRSTASDNWVTEVLNDTGTARLYFSGGSYDLKSADLEWKSMADLAIKQHLRCADGQTWNFEKLEGGSPFVKKDAQQPSGYAPATDFSKLKVVHDDAGDMYVQYESAVDVFQLFLTGNLAGELSSMLKAMLQATTETAFTAWSTFALDDPTKIETSFAMELGPKAIQGTDGISIGNYTDGKLDIKIEAGASGGYGDVVALRTIDKGGVYVMPSTHLDHLRRASKDNLAPRITLTLSEDNGCLSSAPVQANLSHTGSGPIVRASVLSPNSVVEVDWDQQNSMNVLATAAFAGLSGLASVGAATELRQLIEASPLADLFRQLAIQVGGTTAAVISGYVSALVASYVNGWISNDQLFDINQHVAWISNGFKTLAIAGTAGVVGTTGLLGAFNALGVSSDVVSTAITAAGGAATGAGVALGMASVMAKVVRHRYWGE